MKEFLQLLQEAFPFLRDHLVATARVCVLLVAVGGFFKAKPWRARYFKPLASRLEARIFSTNRWLYVYQETQLTNDWKYYTSEVKGSGGVGDDIVWTLVTWPSFRPKDTFTLSGVVGMVDAINQAEAKLRGRWEIEHDSDGSPVGMIPARGLKSLIRRGCWRVLYFLGSI